MCTIKKGNCAPILKYGSCAKNNSFGESNKVKTMKTIFYSISYNGVTSNVCLRCQATKECLGYLDKHTVKLRSHSKKALQ